MTLSLKLLPKVKQKSRVRVGRGIGSGKGKTCGRGVKGQKARTGHHSVKGFEGGQTPVYMRLPKKGFTNALGKDVDTITVDKILQFISAGKLDHNAVVTKKKLFELGLICNERAPVKLLMGKGQVDSAFKVALELSSKNAKSFLANE